MRHALKSKTPSAAARHFYISRTGKYRALDGERDDLITYGFGNMPAFADDNPALFWESADEYERKNARLCLELELNLPNELKPGQQVEVIERYIQWLNGAAGRFPYSYAIHCDEHGKNPHVHLMFSERVLDDIERPKEVFFKRANKQHAEQGGVVKSRFWHHKKQVYLSRSVWADCCNQVLVNNGYEARFDPRTKQAQKADALERGDLLQAVLLSTHTEKHEGWYVAGMAKRMKAGELKPDNIPSEALATIENNQRIREYNCSLRDWAKIANEQQLEAFLACDDPVQFIVEQYKEPTIQDVVKDKQFVERERQQNTDSIGLETSAIKKLSALKNDLESTISLNTQQSLTAKEKVEQLALGSFKQVLAWTRFIKDEAKPYREQLKELTHQISLDTQTLELNKAELNVAYSRKQSLESQQQMLGEIDKQLDTLSFTVLSEEERQQNLRESMDHLLHLSSELRLLRTKKSLELSVKIQAEISKQQHFLSDKSECVLAESQLKILKSNRFLSVEANQSIEREREVASAEALTKEKAKQALADARNRILDVYDEIEPVIKKLSPTKFAGLSNESFELWTQLREKNEQLFSYIETTFKASIDQHYTIIVDIEKHMELARDLLEKIKSSLNNEQFFEVFGKQRQQYSSGMSM
jgi:hypothetical protein